MPREESGPPMNDFKIDLEVIYLFIKMEPPIDVGYLIFGYSLSLWAIFMYLNYKKHLCMKCLRKIYSEDLKKLTDMTHMTHWSDVEMGTEKQG
jgi:hypothetical protein